MQVINGCRLPVFLHSIAKNIYLSILRSNPKISNCIFLSLNFLFHCNMAISKVNEIIFLIFCNYCTIILSFCVLFYPTESTILVKQTVVHTLKYFQVPLASLKIERKETALWQNNHQRNIYSCYYFS